MLSLLFLSLLLSGALPSDALYPLTGEELSQVLRQSQPLYVTQLPRSRKSIHDVRSALSYIQNHFYKDIYVYEKFGNPQLPDCQAWNWTQPRNKMAGIAVFQKPLTNLIELQTLSEMQLDMAIWMKSRKKIFVFSIYSEYNKYEMEKLLCYIRKKSPNRFLVVTIVQDMVKPAVNRFPFESTQPVQTFPTAKTYTTVHNLQGFPSTTTRPLWRDVTTKKFPDLTKSETTDTGVRRPSLVSTASPSFWRTSTTTKFPNSVNRYITDHKVQGFTSTTTRTHYLPPTSKTFQDLTKSETTDTGVRRPGLVSTAPQPFWSTSTTTKFPNSVNKYTTTDHKVQSFSSTTIRPQWWPSTTTKSPDPTKKETDDTGVGSSSVGNNPEVDSAEEISDSGTECWVFSSFASKPFSEPDRKPFSEPDRKQRKPHVMKNKWKRSTSSDSYDGKNFNSERTLENVDEDDEQTLPMETLISNGDPGTYEESGLDDDPQSQGTQVSCESGVCAISSSQMRKNLDALTPIEPATPNFHEVEPYPEFPLQQKDKDETSGTTGPAYSSEEDWNASNESNFMPPVVKKPNYEPTQQDVLEGNDYDTDKGNNEWFRNGFEKARNAFGRFVGSVKDTGKKGFRYVKERYNEFRRKLWNSE